MNASSLPDGMSGGTMVDAQLGRQFGKMHKLASLRASMAQ